MSPSSPCSVPGVLLAVSSWFVEEITKMCCSRIRPGFSEACSRRLPPLAPFQVCCSRIRPGFSEACSRRLPPPASSPFQVCCSRFRPALLKKKKVSFHNTQKQHKNLTDSSSMRTGFFGGVSPSNC
uniref:(northern house mosquito) hypothetical protein n=1 Tax=Culex pipiens TaxID=7175 RepID=A0A8D8HXI5_CULPI